MLHVGVPARWCNTSDTERFEPLRAEPNGFRVHLLNRSDTVSCQRRTGCATNGAKPTSRATAQQSYCAAAKLVPRGLEPRTLWLLAVRSNQLSYETRCVCHCGMLAIFIVQVFRALGSAIAIAAMRARNLHDTLIPRRALWPNG